MNFSRRKFCQVSLLGAIAALFTPRRAAAMAVSRGSLRGRCRVEVIRCQCFEELQGCYLDDPEAGPCPRFKVGDSFEVTPSNLEQMRCGKRVCPQAWRALEPYVMASLSADETADCAPAITDTQAVVSCPDGTRPVIFKVTSLI